MQRVGASRPNPLLAPLILAALIALPARAQILGANFNELPRNASTAELLASKTTWSRGFIDILGKEGVGNLLSDPDIVGLRRSADSGQQLLVSFKWNFKNAGERVPAPGSPREATLFDRAAQTLVAIGRPVNSIVLGNEPMFETLQLDLQSDGQSVPYVRFTERLLEHLRNAYGAQQATEPRYFVGSLNRLDRSSNQSLDVVREMFQLARDNAAVAGMDVHAHFSTLDEANSMLSFARQELAGATKDLIVTEFSPVWRYQAALDDPIGVTAVGQTFATAYGYDPNLHVDGYLQQAFNTQVSRREWTDFIESQPWSNPDHLEDMHQLFRQHDVAIGTLGFSQPLSMRGMNVTRDGYSPFHINWLYIYAMVDEGSSLDSYNERYMEDWLAIQADAADVNRDGMVDFTDYNLMKDYFDADFSTMTFHQALQRGDLNLDRRVTRDDLKIFFASYVALNGRAIGDLDGDGMVTRSDWPLLAQSLLADTTGLDPAAAWSSGDFDGSGVVDRIDFRLFKDAYIATHGEDAFAALFSVPEPSALVLAVAVLVPWQWRPAHQCGASP
ncbi:hypothetical protein Pla175_30160 [Pirellulimonas nuda]|uniref:Dockerin domain-containing protein n=1 Tax=Pirellulimonas nuda TaxID=2528009 RepID=A0A518DDS6_9BACT|nr:dockerin type I domain-containing protein [Pirellulimonas nuda]QDU89623.1 hypothetical protein Pla175_30160 [Pirellulimonas nuda]